MIQTVHVAEDASESAFIRDPGANEIVTGSPQNAAYSHVHVHVPSACYVVMTSGL